MPFPQTVYFRYLNYLDLYKFALSCDIIPTLSPGYLESCAKISRLSAAGIHQFSTPFSKMTLCRMPTSFFGTCWIVSTLNSFNFSLVPNLTKPGWMNSDLPGQFLTVRYQAFDFILVEMICVILNI